MRAAIKEAHLALDKGEIPIGAVVVAMGQIIAKGHNLTQTLTDTTAHAEMQAITAASGHLGNKYLNQCILYVTLEPCAMCAGALYWSQMGEVVFGAYEIKHQHPKTYHPKTKLLGGVLESECGELLQRFFKTKR
ncbi:unnamed protein product [Notodromas monacha]|uniref:tRNA-specific adenosine deaminase 2 n=1 Tax=Notodromas monacha TaxID=399045 RepID=A0A7R9C2C7_9CRUS|nr:unnamed protein product [Notodromas monacha]CAG0926133.1 unnamed protein product [Notodromas monacha]